MKKITKTFATLLSAAVVFSSGAACKKNADTSDTLVITAAKLGYGLDWLNSMADGWSAKTGNKTKIVQKVGTSGNNAITEEIASLASSSDIFIYRTADYADKVYQGEVKHAGEKYDCVYLDLTDVYDSEIEGESVAVGAKIVDKYKTALNVNGKYYAVPWIEGTMGLMRNVTLWNKLGLTDADVPLTTDQLKETCDKILDATSADRKYQNVAPFIYSAEDEYYTSFIPVWFAQYEGVQNTERYKQGLDPDGKLSKNIFNYDGFEEMFNVINDLLDPDNGYQHSKSSSLNFTDMQGQFLMEQAVFCVNGAWIEIEMGNSFPDVQIDYVKTPVISALVKKTSFYDKNDVTGANDEKLATLIKYVDANKTGYNGKPDFATEADVDLAREARNYGYTTLSSTHVLVGSSYSKKTDMIKSFIRYMYSDEGLDLYYRATGGARLPAQRAAGAYPQDVAVSDFKKSVNAIDGNEILVFASTAKLFSVGGVSIRALNGITNYISAFASKKMTPRQVVQKNQQYMSDNWSVIASKL
ncbi:MAG: ABC transporter substrate-binding protein [Candidatus Borkfalkiaceae bacterium]|nr:ABC transporter substrate-binding protein [Clostridia bacterium]MDY6224102.1 ABC transporter substrate-binding protein [Christensenellaceae bacterium]